jgi:predicted permease
MALGIGATTAIFSVANAMLLRPLPVRDPHRLATVSSDTALQFGFGGGPGWNYALWDAFRGRWAAFDGAFAWTLQTIDLAASGEMQPAQVLFASGDFFTMLGVEPVVGRIFDARDDVRGGGPDGPVAVIGFDAWRQRFDGAPDIASRHVAIGGVPVRIAGVAPRGFLGVDAGQRFDFVMPLGAEPLVRGTQSIVASPRAMLLTVMIRLRPGQSIEQGQAAMRAAHRDALQALPESPRMLEDPVVLVPAATGLSDRSRLRQQYERPVVIVGVIGACVLVVGCLNLANLLLARAAAVRGEFGLRLALGASRWLIGRQLIVEGALLVALGAMLGVLAAEWGSRALVAVLPLAAAPAHLDLSLDWRVAAFATGSAALTLTLCSVLPVLLAFRVSPRDVMGPAAFRGQSAPAALAGGLVIVQVAISSVLVLAAGLFVGTAVGLSRVPLGFDADPLLVVTVDTRQTATSPPQQPALFDRIVAGLSALPGVTHAAGSIWTPIGGGGGGLLTDARGRQHVPPERSAFNFVTPGWFAAYGMRLIAGRDFAAADGAGAARVAIVNETLARRQVDGSVLGRLTEAGPCGREMCTIVGVVPDARYGASPRDPVPPTIYMPLSQSAGLTPPGTARVRVTLRLASDAPPPGSAATAAALERVDPRITFGVQPLSADVRRSYAQERLLAALAVVFGSLALLLAGLGIYGVTAYGVTRRRTELAIRLALGASPGSIVALVARQTLRRLAVGIAIGLAFAYWLSRFVATLLFGVEPLGPLSVLAVVAALAAAGGIAAWAPLVRAARVQPASLLRADW